MYRPDEGKIGCSALSEAKTSKIGNTHREIWTYFESFLVLYPMYRPNEGKFGCSALYEA